MSLEMMPLEDWLGRRVKIVPIYNGYPEPDLAVVDELIEASGAGVVVRSSEGSETFYPLHAVHRMRLLEAE